MRSTSIDIGVALSPSAKQDIQNLIDKLKSRPEIKKHVALVDFVDPERSFISIINLGLLHDDRLEKAIECTKVTALQTDEFEARLDFLSYFYTERKNQDSLIIWQLGDKEEHFKNLYKALFDSLTEAEFYPPTRFKPFVAIGRIRKQKSPNKLQEALDKITDVESDSRTPFLVQKLNMYKVTSFRTGPDSYKRLKLFPLQTT